MSALLNEWPNTQGKWSMGKPDFISLLWPKVKGKRTYYTFVGIQMEEPMTHQAILGNARVEAGLSLHQEVNQWLKEVSCTLSWAQKRNFN